MTIKWHGDDYDESDDDEDKVSSMERNVILRLKRAHRWSCCGGSFDSLGCTSGKSLFLGEEEIQHLIDENDEKRESILHDNDNNDDDDLGYDSGDFDDDGVYDDRDWDESTGGDAKRWCQCGYKEGHYDYCIC